MVDVYRLGSDYIVADEELEGSSIDPAVDYVGRSEEHEVEDFSSDIQGLEIEDSLLHWARTDRETIREVLGEKQGGRT